MLGFLKKACAVLAKYGRDSGGRDFFVALENGRDFRKSLPHKVGILD